MDIVRIQDIGLSGKNDEHVLAAALAESRILLTHDVRTIPALAIEGLNAGQSIPGILLVEQVAPVGQIISDLLLMAECSEMAEWEGQMHYLPL